MHILGSLLISLAALTVAHHIIDLGYERYQGHYNVSTSLIAFYGIRYAAAPTGQYRWQAPRPPTEGRSRILQAEKLPPSCPQSLAAPNYPTSLEGDEDCLFLNVFAPPGAESLPVLVWIHGGGFGQGRGDQDLGAIIRSNNNIFIGVAIQYRVGESPLNGLPD